MLNCPLSKKGSYICIESEWRLTRVQCAQYTHHTIKYNPPIYSHTLKYSTLECKMTFSNRWDFHSLVSGIVVSFSKLKCNCSEPSAAFFFARLDDASWQVWIDATTVYHFIVVPFGDGVIHTNRTHTDFCRTMEMPPQTAWVFRNRRENEDGVTMFTFIVAFYPGFSSH